MNAMYAVPYSWSMLSLTQFYVVHIMHGARTADSSTKQQIRVLALHCIAVHVAMLEFCYI